MKKVIFLDIDGVLNSEDFYINRVKPAKEDRCYSFHYYDLDEEKVKILNEIIEKTKATIVLSSSWRYLGLNVVNEALREAGFKYTIDFSTIKGPDNRGKQILLFVEGFEVEDYIVLDDEGCDITEYISKEQFVKTSWKLGIQEEHKDYIINYFNRK